MRFRISNYLVELYGGERKPDEPNPSEGYRAQILLFDWGNNKRRSVVRFFDEGPIPEDYRQEDGLIAIHMPTSMLANTVDILRNENPVFLEWRKEIGRASCRERV